MRLDKLIQKRKEHLKSCVENDDHSHELIAGLYSDASHFVYELLQNADDVKASEVIFELREDYLKVIHNGKRPFDEEDIESITTVGASTKANEPNSIGTFGAGFKSVFAVTDSPQIHSGEYHIEIIDYILPQKVDPIETDGDTIIILPFNKSELVPKEAYGQIAERLENLKAESLLFLRYINQIKWTTEESRGNYTSRINSSHATVISEINDDSNSQEYLLFRKPINIEKVQLNLAIAFPLDAGESNKIMPLHDTNLFVFFPTNERTRLKFLVHVPYKTTPSRESIPFNDEQNQHLTKELSHIFAESILKIRDKGYLEVDFLTALPNDETEDQPVYKALFDALKELYFSKNILPTHDGHHIYASNALLAREKELVDLLDSSDCEQLFERQEWLDTNITINKTTTFRKYLIKQLDIPEVNIEDFCNSITEDFIKHKSDEWLVEFYSAMTNQKSLYKKRSRYKRKGVLREKPIIRLNDGSHVRVENDSDEIQVYLPADQESEFKTVKRSIARKENAQAFLINLGLKEPDDISEIKENILPRYEKANSSVSQKQNLQDFEKVFRIWKDSDEYQKSEIVDILKSVPFIGCVKGNSFHIKKPSKVYFRTERLLNWFDGNDQDDFYFLQNELIGEGYGKFLIKLGVLRNLSIEGSETYSISARGFYMRGVNGFNQNFQIHGLQYALENININRSILLWNTLLEYPNKLTGYRKKKTNKSKSYKRKSEREQSKAMKLISSSYWLYDQKDKLIKRSLDQVLLDDLNNRYKKDHANIDRLISGLRMKLDEVKRFEEKTGKKVITQSEYEEYKQYKKEQLENREVETSDGWKAEIKPEDAEVVVNKHGSTKKDDKDLSGQELSSKTSSNSTNSNSKSKSNNSNGLDNHEKGLWGEQFALRHLKSIYPEKEVIHLNEEGNVGEGYDFVIREDDHDIAYYEVKSKEAETPSSFEISRVQWNWAKKLHERGEGDKYYILLVSNAGTGDATITPFQNPIELWEKGELEADPVKIRL